MNYIHAYQGIPRSEILKQRMTTKGQKFTLNHPKELIVSMRYTPTASSKNAQGWERDQKAYWAAIRERYPQCLDSRNQKLIANGNSPRVNKAFIDSFPQYKEFKGQTLFHHHIGGYGDAVAAPKDLHTGSGGIHIIEKQLHITENAKKISRECRRLCAKDQRLYGKRSIDFQKLMCRDNEQTKTAVNIKVNKGCGNLIDKTLPDQKKVAQNDKKETQSHQQKSLDKSR